MGFWNRIVENKMAVIAISGATLCGGVYLAFRNLKRLFLNQPQQLLTLQQLAKEFDLAAETSKLLLVVQIGNLSPQDIKKIVALTIQYALFFFFKLRNWCKENRRRLFPKERRYTHMKDYFQLFLKETQQISVQTIHHSKIMKEVFRLFGLSQNILQRPDIVQFSNEHKKKVIRQRVSTKPTLEDFRFYIQVQKQYLIINKQKITEKLIQLSELLPIPDMQLLGMFLIHLLSDEILEGRPDLQKIDEIIQINDYPNQLQFDLTVFAAAFMQIISTVQNRIQGRNFNGVAGFDRQILIPNQNNNGRVPNFNVIEQQLEEIQHYNPQAYGNIMAKLQAEIAAASPRSASA